MSAGLHHLSGPYAVDALDDDERRAFEAHHPTCDVCGREVDEFLATASVLAGATAANPPVGLKAPVMAAVSRTRQVSPVYATSVVDLRARRRRRPRRSAVFAAVAALVVALAGVVTVLRNSADGDAEVLALLSAPDATVVTLDPVAGAGGSMQVVWSPAGDDVAVLAGGVDGAGVGSAYALWLVLPDGVVPAGLFTPDADGTVRTVLAVDDLDAVGWAVTVEPASGSQQPTGEVLYSGEA